MFVLLIYIKERMSDIMVINTDFRRSTGIWELARSLHFVQQRRSHHHQCSFISGQTMQPSNQVETKYSSCICSTSAQHTSDIMSLMLWQDLNAMSMDNSDEYPPVIVQDATLVQGGKPRLVWIKPKEKPSRHRELDMCLSIIGMRHLIKDEIFRNQQRLRMYRLKPAE